MRERPRKSRRWLGASAVPIVALAVIGMAGVLHASSPILRTVTVGQFPALAVVSAPQGRLFVPNTDDATVSVLDTRTGQLLRTVRVGGQSSQHIYNAVADARSGHVFIVTDDNDITMLDARSGGAVHTLSRSLVPCAGGLATDARRAHLFSTDCQNGIVRVIDARTGRIVAAIHVGGSPSQVAVDEQTERVFVAGDELSGGRISVLDAASGRVVRTLMLGSQLCLCITAPVRGGPVLVYDPLNAVVYELDARSGRLLRSIAIGIDIYDHGVDARTGRVFLVGAPAGTGNTTTPYAGPGRLVVLDGLSGRMLRRLTLAAPPSALALDTQRQRLLLSFIGHTDDLGQPSGMGHVAVLNERGLRVLRSIPVGIVPWQIVVDTATDHAFVVNANVVPNGTLNTNTYLPTHVVMSEDWWHATLRRLTRLLPWLPLRLAPSPKTPIDGSVTVLDLARI